jgi:hypothetical protein
MTFQFTEWKASGKDSTRVIMSSPAAIIAIRDLLPGNATNKI